MKKLVFLATAFLLPVLTRAQLTREQRLETTVIGWDPANYYDRNYKPKTSPVDKQREGYVNKFAEWVKKSYTPVAGLGEYQRYVREYNYHVLFSVWDVDYNYLNAQKNFKPIGETGFPRFNVGANLLAGTSDIAFMSSPEAWYFTMESKGFAPFGRQDAMKDRNPDIDPNVSRYLTWYNENTCAVYLTPGNKLPLIPVTKGEFLDRALASMDGVLEKIRKDETERWRDRPENVPSVMKLKTEEVDKIRANIRSLQDKYRSRLNEPARVTNAQFDWRQITTGSWDVFTNAPNSSYYPVYKIGAETITKMRGAEPVWIAAIFPYHTKNDGNKNYEMYAAMTRNINYEYIYNYFFAPDQVKGKSYSPANEAELKARLEAYGKRNAYTGSAPPTPANLPANVHFQETFSKDAVGSEPADWYYYRTGSTPFAVTNLPGTSGNWLKMGVGRSIKPMYLKAPLPKNFTLEYDVATDNGFSGRTGGAVELMITSRPLSANNSETKSNLLKDASITVRVEAGNEADDASNYRGLLRVKISNTPEVNEENFVKGITAEYPLKAFTNRKTSVHISVQVKDGAVSVLVNNNVVIKPSDFKMTYGGACKLCGVDPAQSFSNLLWNNVTNDSKAVGVYIGNVKVMRE
ncbi:hypothetical protein [Arsenicibacter rosenii]|uniref:Uncharacterized protein n=1 Tax=Arsenicibacter rosenii TaxID=1750698 RepID=A0A1S2VI37_9BACT|nr:hypothetical protein [Arsenicibacter rosenii]OIN57876.1 hypothetical protein BLX24_17420 [Arsenicibacter rosenii]